MSNRIYAKVDVLNIPSHLARTEYVNALQSFMTESLDESNSTPDATALQLHTHQDVFVFGSMKKGFRQHRLIGENAVALGVGYTNSNQFVMHIVGRTTPYPVILIDGNNTEAAAIYGELWRVPTKRMFAMDFYEANSVDTRRLKIPIRYFTKKGDLARTHAWVYVGLRKTWDPKIAGQTKLKIFQPAPLIAKIGGTHSLKYYNYRWIDDKPPGEQGVIIH